MDEILKPRFWTYDRRKWLYAVMVSLMPIMITFGTITGEVAGMILNTAGTILGVTGGAMALTNVTPDNVFKIAVEMDGEEK